MSKNAIIVIIVAVLIGVGGVAYGLVQKNDKEEAQAKASNNAMMLKEAKEQLNQEEKSSDESMMKSEDDSMMKSDDSMSKDSDSASMNDNTTTDTSADDSMTQ